MLRRPLEPATLIRFLASITGGIRDQAATLAASRFIPEAVRPWFPQPAVRPLGRVPGKEEKSSHDHFDDQVEQRNAGQRPVDECGDDAPCGHAKQCN